MVDRGSGAKSMSRLCQALVVGLLLLVVWPLASATAAPPAVSISSPVAASSIAESAPLITGTTSDGADVVKVEIYDGTGTAGTLAQTLESSTPSGGAWSAQTSPLLRNGTYTAVAEQVELGTLEPPGVSAPVTFTIEAPLPAVLLEPVAALGKDTKPTFSGSAGTAPGDVATVKVSIYSGATASGSPLETIQTTPSGASWVATPTNALPEGEYTALAEQADEAGNVGRSTASTFTIDTTPPSVSLTPMAALGNNPKPSFAGTAGTAPRDIAVVKLSIYAGTVASGSPVEIVKAPVGGGASWAATPAKALPDGTYTAIAEQSDEAGNVGSTQPSTFRIDATAPKVTLVTPANGSSGKNENVLFSGKAGNEAGDDSTVTLDIYEVGSSQPLETVHIERSGEQWESAGTKLPEGEYIAQALQSDTAGNTGVSSPHAFAIRTAAPVVTLATSTFVRRGAKLVTGSARPELRTEPASGGVRSVELDLYKGTSSSASPIEEVPMEADAGGTWAARPGNALPEGTYTAQAQVEDFAANTGVSAPVVFTVDETRPTVTLSSPAGGGSLPGTEPVLVAGTADLGEGDQPAVTVQVFAGASTASRPFEEVVVDASPSGSWSVPIGGLAAGVYTVRAQQSDDVGNRGSSGTSTFTVTAVTAPPTAPAVTPAQPSPPVASFTWAPTNPTVGQSVSLASSSTDASGAIGSYAWDLAGGGQFAAGAAVMTTSFATAGPHVVQLRVTDGGGRSSTVAQTIDVTPAPPRLMQPFPVVRIAGSETSSGVRIRLLTVQAPAGATVQVTCAGRGCKPKSESRVAVASSAANAPSGASMLTFKRFERSLGAGVTLQIRVTKAGEIGKYTSFAVRRNKLPVRTDACLQPTSAKPSACPSS